MKWVILALALASSTAFAQNCTLVDQVSGDSGKYFNEVDSNPLQIVSDTKVIAKSKLFEVTIELNKEKHEIVYQFTRLSPTGTASQPTAIQTIPSDSPDALSQIKSEDIVYSDAWRAKAQIVCPN